MVGLDALLVVSAVQGLGKRGAHMPQGQVIADHLKRCARCGLTYNRIVARDADAAVLRCSCGHEWTAYYEKPRPLPNSRTV